MAKVNISPKDAFSRRQVLRAIFKIFSAIALLFLAYIFTVGLFGPEKESAKVHYAFDLSKLNNNEATYFKLGKREVLIIKHKEAPIIFWANDPVYGCKLEFLNTFIKPVCIDIKYNLNGYSADKSQQLPAPDFTLNTQSVLFTSR